MNVQTPSYSKDEYFHIRMDHVAKTGRTKLKDHKNYFRMEYHTVTAQFCPAKRNTLNLICNVQVVFII